MTTLLTSSPETRCARRHPRWAFFHECFHRPVLPVALITIAGVLNGCRHEILSDLTEREAAKITNELRLRGIDATCAESGKQRYALSVAKGDEGEASRIAGLIKPLLSIRAESEKPPGILSGPDQERLYVSRQLAHQLEESLQLLSAVVAARVTIAFPPKLAIDEQRGKVVDPGSASVLIIASPNSHLSAESLSQFISNGSTIPRDRIHLIISELPGGGPANEKPALDSDEVSAPDTGVAAAPITPASSQREGRAEVVTLAEQETTPHLSIQPSPPSEEQIPERPNVPRAQDSSPQEVTKAVLIHPFTGHTTIISCLGFLIFAIPLVLRLRARSLRLAFRNLV